jgi:O-antigen ligase
VAAALATLIMISIGLLHPMLVRARRTAGTIAAAIIAGILFVALSTGEAGILRFLAADPRDIATDTRMQIWQASIRAWRLFPTFGSGLGTFREAFRRVQPREIQGLVEQAHNDFLQLLVTGGWIGACLGAAAFASLFFLMLHRWRSQRHREESAIALAALAALLSLALHGIVEFNMSIPAIPATLAVTLGAAWASVHEVRKNVRPR